MNSKACIRPGALRPVVLALALIVIAMPTTAVGYPIPMEPTTWVPTGPAAQAHYGWSVATAGDVNGDGRSDVIVGAPSYGNGRAWVYHGGVNMDMVHEWTVGGPASSSYGYSVAPAGDVNGDGYDDVLVGAPSGTGYAFCYHGSANGLEGVPAWVRTGSTGSLYGTSVATAGDINGDGYSDVLVGAPNWGGQFGDLGRVYLYLGSASGLATSPVWSYTGVNPADVGRSVASAGDVNADGYDDFLVGDPGYDAGAVSQNNGRVLLFFGHASGTPVQSVWSLVGPAAGAQYGTVVAPAGDYNRDGYADALMGSPYYNFTAGRVVLLRGHANGFTTGGTFDGSAVAGYGHSVAPAGDLNGDGYADIVISALFEGPNDEGKVYVHHGNSSGLLGSPAWILDGTQAGGNLGRSVATAGDVDGDGFADLLIGEDFYDVGANQNAGRAHLFRGATAGMSTASFWTLNGDQAGEKYGASVAALDANADAFDDLLVGAPEFDGAAGANAGRVELIYGSPEWLQTLSTWVLEGDAVGDGFGYAVARAGDVNRDGFDDFLVGVPGDDTRGSNAGQARLFYGGASGPSMAPAWTSDVGGTGDSVGTALAFGGDINGDGYVDALVGASAHGTHGAVFCYLGTPAGLSPTPAATLVGPQAGSRFGFSVGSADRDGDGYTDVFVGAPGWDGTYADEGRVLGFRGGPGGLETTPTWDWVGSTIAAPANPTGIQLGYAVCGIAGAGGGSDGVAFSAPWWSPLSSTPRGMVWFDFDDGGPDGTFSSHEGAMLGFSIADGGDCDGDGRGDVVIGAPGFDYGTTDDGGWGVHSVVDADEWWTYLWQFNALGGYAVTAGDFDGDGLSDAAGSAIGGDGMVGVRRAGSSGYWTPYAAELRNSSGMRLARLGVTDEEEAVYLSFDRAQSTAGRTHVRQEWWVYPTADAPGPEDLTISGTGPWTDTGPIMFPLGSSAALLDTVSGLAPSTLYSIQARFRTRNPFFPYSRWFRVGDAGRNAGHFRTAGSLVTVGEPIPTPAHGVRAFPNPFRGGTLLRFTMPSPGDLEARIYDVSGRLVRTLARRGIEAGPQELHWDGFTGRGERATPGIYYVRVRNGSDTAEGRIVRMW